MDLIFEPTIDLIGYTEFVEPKDGPKVNWINPSTSSEQLAEFSGRLCYLSFDNPAGRSTPEYITNILKQAHFSVIEHANISLLIQGISRSCSHELVRHRHFSFSQLSQRYCDESKAAFVVPPALIDTDLSQWTHNIKEAQLAYIRQVEVLFQTYAHIEDTTHRRKVAREAARSLLPNATETKMVLTGNLRAWRHLLELRTSEFADREIRRLSILILNTIKALAPTVFADFEIYQPGDGQIAAKYTYKGA